MRSGLLGIFVLLIVFVVFVVPGIIIAVVLGTAKGKQNKQSDATVNEYTNNRQGPLA